MRAQCIAGGIGIAAPDVDRKAAVLAATRPELIGTAPILQFVQQVRIGDEQFHDMDSYTGRVVLQEGRHSLVVSAWHSTTSQPVVIKAYSKAALKPRQLTASYREVRLLHHLIGIGCPGVVTMLAASENEDKLYIVFKACMRGDLYQLLMKESTRRLNEHLVASTIVLPLVLTVAELHSMQIVHRDIKPENVFIDIDGHIQLGDFGLAAQHSDTLMERVGTLDYMAPEVLAMPTPSEAEAGRGIPPYPYNEKVDVWAIGCLSYELLVGSPPFEVEDPKETAKLIMIGKPAPFPPGISPAACDFILQTLSHKHHQRPSARQLLDHPWLRPHMQGLQRRNERHAKHEQHKHEHHTHDDGGTISPSLSSHASGTQTPLTHQISDDSSSQQSPCVHEEAWGINSLGLLQIHEQQQQQRALAEQAPQLPSSSSQDPVPMLHAYPTSTSRGSTDVQGTGIGHERLLPPGHELSEASSTEETSECGAAGGKSFALRPTNNRRASSGTSEYLTYNTPRANSPEHMTRSCSATTPMSPFCSLVAIPGGAIGDGHPVSLRQTSSCNGSVEGSGPEPDPPGQTLAWQASTPTCKKTVGKSRFAR